jgi:hypothetical protein
MTSNFRQSLVRLLTINESDLVKQEEIGHGAFGFVHRGSYRGQPVCIKVTLVLALCSRPSFTVFRRLVAGILLVVG